MTAPLERIVPIPGPDPRPGEVFVAADPAGVALAAAERICTALSAALAQRESANIALTGGSSAMALALELRKPRWQDALTWDRVGVWWGDERFVPADSPDCNFAEAFRDLLNQGGLPVPRANIHPFPVETALAEGRDMAWVAQAYAWELQTMLPHRDGLPAFDVILLGMGSDGHILSVFPDSRAFEPDAPLVLDVPAPTHITPHLPRVTINPRLLGVASHVLLMAPGAAKAGTVSRALTGERDPRKLPVQLTLSPNATWLLDTGSAAELLAERVPVQA